MIHIVPSKANLGMVFSWEGAAIVSCLVSLLQKREVVFVYFPGTENVDVT